MESGIVSRNTLEMELALEQLEILDVEGFPITDNWYLVYRKEKRFTVLASAFKDLVINDASAILAR